MIPTTTRTSERVSPDESVPTVEKRNIDDVEATDNERTYTPFDPQAELEAIKQARIETQQIHNPEERQAFREGLRARIEGFKQNYMDQRMEVANCMLYIKETLDVSSAPEISELEQYYRRGRFSNKQITAIESGIERMILRGVVIESYAEMYDNDNEGLVEQLFETEIHGKTEIVATAASLHIRVFDESDLRRILESDYARNENITDPKVLEDLTERDLSCLGFAISDVEIEDLNYSIVIENATINQTETTTEEHDIITEEDYETDDTRLTGMSFNDGSPIIIFQRSENGIIENIKQFRREDDKDLFVQSHTLLPNGTWLQIPGNEIIEEPVLDVVISDEIALSIDESSVEMLNQSGSGVEITLSDSNVEIANTHTSNAIVRHEEQHQIYALLEDLIDEEASSDINIAIKNELLAQIAEEMDINDSIARTEGYLGDILATHTDDTSQSYTLETLQAEFGKYSSAAVRLNATVEDRRVLVAILMSEPIESWPQLASLLERTD